MNFNKGSLCKHGSTLGQVRFQYTINNHIRFLDVKQRKDSLHEARLQKMLL